MRKMFSRRQLFAPLLFLVILVGGFASQLIQPRPVVAATSGWQYLYSGSVPTKSNAESLILVNAQGCTSNNLNSCQSRDTAFHYGGGPPYTFTNNNHVAGDSIQDKIVTIKSGDPTIALSTKGAAVITGIKNTDFFNSVVGGSTGGTTGTPKFNWVSSKEIDSVGGKKFLQQQSLGSDGQAHTTDSNFFVRDGKFVCQDNLFVSANKNFATLNLSFQATSAQAAINAAKSDYAGEGLDYALTSPTKSGGTVGQPCWTFSNINISLGNSANANPAAGGNNATGTGTSCEGTAGPLGWIICGVINFISDTVQNIGDGITNLLKTTPITQMAGLYTAWGNIRNLANALLIIVFLIIIFGQSVGLDNYTIKKSLPRIVAAAILIQLSFFICSLAVDITNILGASVGNFVAGLGSGNVTWHLSGTIAWLGTPGAVIGGLAVGAALVSSVGSGAALFAMIAVLIAIIAAFLTIAFRKLAIIILILVAPLALLLWVLPNTEKYFKFWWENFIKILLMFPLMALIFAASQFAYNINAAEAQDTWGQLLNIGIIIAPLFALPMTFKWGGKMMSFGAGAIAGIASRGNKSFGLGSQADKNFRKARQESRALQAREGTIFGKKPESAALQKAARGFGQLGLGVSTAIPGRASRRKQAAAYGAAVEARRKDLLAGTENKSAAEIFGMAQSSLGEFVKSGGTQGREELQTYIEKLSTMGGGGRDAVAALSAEARAATDTSGRPIFGDPKAGARIDSAQWGNLLGKSAAEFGPKSPDAMSVDGSKPAWKFDGAGAGALRQMDKGSMARLLDQAFKSRDPKGFLTSSGIQESEIKSMATDPTKRPDDAFVTRGFQTIAQEMGWGAIFGPSVSLVAPADVSTMVLDQAEALKS